MVFCGAGGTNVELFSGGFGAFGKVDSLILHT